MDSNPEKTQECDTNSMDITEQEMDGLYMPAFFCPICVQINISLFHLAHFPQVRGIFPAHSLFKPDILSSDVVSHYTLCFEAYMEKPINYHLYMFEMYETLLVDINDYNGTDMVMQSLIDWVEFYGFGYMGHP